MKTRHRPVTARITGSSRSAVLEPVATRNPAASSTMAQPRNRLAVAAHVEPEMIRITMAAPASFLCGKMPRHSPGWLGSEFTSKAEWIARSGTSATAR